MDPILLAQSVLSSFLIPLAADAWDAIRKKLAAEVSESAAKEATSLARRVRDKVRDAFRAHGSAELFDEFEDSNGTNADEIGARLAEAVERDPALHAELEQLTHTYNQITKQATFTMTGEIVGAVNIQGDMVGGTVTAVDARRGHGSSDSR